MQPSTVAKPWHCEETFVIFEGLSETLFVNVGTWIHCNKGDKRPCSNIVGFFLSSLLSLFCFREDICVFPLIVDNASLIFLCSGSSLLQFSSSWFFSPYLEVFFLSCQGKVMNLVLTVLNHECGGFSILTSLSSIGSLQP